MTKKVGEKKKQSIDKKQVTVKKQVLVKKSPASAVKETKGKMIKDVQPTSVEVNKHETVVLENFDLVIDEELKSCLPAQSEDTKQRLKNSIEQEGCKVPLEVWKTDAGSVVVDGMTRYEICQELDIKPQIIFKQFKDKFEVKKYMIENQLTRRNISDYQKCCVILNLKDGYTQIAKDKIIEAGRIGGKSKGSAKLQTPSNEKFHVMTELSKMVGVSENFLRGVELVLEKATDEEKQLLERDEYSVSGLVKIIKEREKPPVTDNKPTIALVSTNIDTDEIETESESEPQASEIETDVGDMTEDKTHFDIKTDTENKIESDIDPASSGTDSDVSEIENVGNSSIDNDSQVFNLTDQSGTDLIESVAEPSVAEMNVIYHVTSFEKLKQELTEISNRILSQKSVSDIENIILVLSGLVEKYKSSNLVSETDKESTGVQNV